MGCSNSKAETAQVANPAGKSEPRRNRNRRRRSAEQTSSSGGHQHWPPPQPYDNIGKTENPLQGLLDEAGNALAVPLPTRGGAWSFTSDESVFPAGGSETPRASPNRSRAEELEEGPLGNGWTGGVVVIKVIKRKPRRPSVDDDLSSNSSSNEGDSSPHLQVEAESRGSCEQFQEEEESASPRESVVMKPMSPPVHEPGQSSPSTHCPGLTSSSSSSSGSNSEGDSSQQQQ